MPKRYAVGELNNVTDAHFGSQSLVTQQFRVGDLRNVARVERLDLRHVESTRIIS